VRVIATDAPVAPDVARSIVDRDELEAAFARLSPEQRAVVVLHHHLGYPLTEIAATLGIPEGTARSRLHHAVRQLRSALDADAHLLKASEERPA
jgi:RNA polymerase sigma-70 factor (ECF subfamily)